MPQLPVVVAALARDDAAQRELRLDPSALGRSLNLPPEHVAALRSADRFFETERPILDQARQPPLAAAARPQAAAGIFAAAQPAVSGITASADTGTLLPGPTSGTYTISSSATATATATGTPAPGPRPPGPPVPGVTPPGQPAGPPVPGWPPSAPVVPAMPVAPPAVRPPAAPGQPPAALAAQLASLCAGQGGCEAAIVAMVADVCVTANTAITAIAAIARQRKHAGQPRRQGPPPTEPRH